MMCVDLFCGLGGWADGFLAEGWRVIGFDIERHDYGTGGYPGQLVIQDVLTLHGSQFKDAAVIVASPPCQFFSYCAMPWTRAKRLAEEVRNDPERLRKELTLFEACFRIQREASEAAGHYIPLIVENVRGAQPWVGRSRWHYGSFHLWGDVPALMPMTSRLKLKGGDRNKNRADGHAWTHSFADQTGLKLPGNNGPRRWEDREVQRLGDAPVDTFPLDAIDSAHCDNGDYGSKNTGGSWFLRGGQLVRQEPQRSTRREDGTKSADPTRGVRGWFGREGGTGVTVADGAKGAGAGAGWFDSNLRVYGSRSNARKAASAHIAKIPFALARHIARVFKLEAVKDET